MKHVMAVLALVCVATITVAGQQPPANPSGIRPYIEFSVIPAGHMTPTQGAGNDLAVGTPVTSRFLVHRSLCETSIGGPAETLAAAPADARYVFNLSAELLGQTDSTFRVRLTSQHLRFAGSATNEQPYEQTLTLKDGDRITLDMIREATPGCDTAALTLESRFSVRQDSGLAQVVYAADVWLEHRDDSGHQWNQQVTTNLNGTVDVPVVFKDVIFPLPKLVPNQDEFTAYLRVIGTLRARARQDGLIDVEISTQRRAGLLLPSTPPGASGSSTRKVITVRPGETTAIEIPQPSMGMVSTALRVGGKVDGAASGVLRPPTAEDLANLPKMSISGGNFVFNTGAFFKDHVTRLLVRVRPAVPGADQVPQSATAK